jgi:acyl-CoA hydrolase
MSAPDGARLVELVFPTDTNHLGTLFGGTLVAWMDKAAFVAATRRARTRVVVTAHIDDLTFVTPVRQGELVELRADVESVGRTSMRVRVEAHREATGGERELVTTGRFTMVALDDEGRPVPVPAAP